MGHLRGAQTLEGTQEATERGIRRKLQERSAGAHREEFRASDAPMLTAILWTLFLLRLCSVILKVSKPRAIRTLHIKIYSVPICTQQLGTKTPQLCIRFGDMVYLPQFIKILKPPQKDIQELFAHVPATLASVGYSG